MAKRKQQTSTAKGSTLTQKPVNRPEFLTLTPMISAAVIACHFNVHPGAPDEGVFLADLADELIYQCAKIKDGDLSRVESMLVSQAHSLDVLFTTLALKGRENLGTHLDATEKYLRLAMKAQSQCRTTLETLATIKNPPVVFARQANIAHGHQQVNNGESLADARGEAQILQNEQSRLTHEPGQSLEGETSKAAIGEDPRMEAVATIHRPKDARGKSKIKPKQLERRHASVTTQAHKSPEATA